jgi:autism susceptibility gene 2 protein
MEIDVKHTKQRNKRRERAQRMQAERDKDADGVGVGVIADGDSADEDSKKPIRPPQRRKKANIFKEPSPILEEDVVDGFAILSFKTYEDLEVRKVTAGANVFDLMLGTRLIDCARISLNRLLKAMQSGF